MIQIPMLASAVAAVAGKGRLWLEYLIIAGLIAMAGFCLSLWLKNSATETQLEDVRTRLTTAELVSQSHEATIGNLLALRLDDAKALDGVLGELKVMAKTDSVIRWQLKQLEASNEVVKDYLLSPIPLELRCLLERTCAPASGDQAGAGTPYPGTPAPL